MSTTVSKYDKVQQKLEDFRRKKALEKSARAERIKQRVQELHDKRRQTIVHIRSEIGIDGDERGTLGTSVVEKYPSKPATAAGKTISAKSSKQGTQTFAVRAKQAAVQLKGVIKKFANGVTKSFPDEKQEMSAVEPASARRLTMTLSDSFIQSSSVDIAMVAQKENKPVIPSSYSEIRNVNVDTKPLTSAGANANMKYVSSKKPEAANNLSKVIVTRKRVLVSSVGGPNTKKVRNDDREKPVIVDNALNTDRQKTNLTREEQLQIWRLQKLESKNLAEQKKCDVAAERRKTMSSGTKRATMSGNSRNRSGVLDRLNVTKRTLDVSARPGKQIFNKPVSKLTGPAVNVGRSNVSAVKPGASLVKIVRQNEQQKAHGTYAGAPASLKRQSVGRRSLGIPQAMKPPNMQVKKPAIMQAPIPKLDSVARRSVGPTQSTNKNNEKCTVLTVGQGLGRKVPSSVGPQVSTPYSHRRVTPSVQTPMYSCIPGPKVVSFRTPASAKRTPKPTRTPKLDEETCLREKLNKWLAAKGKTPSRYRHLTCFGLHGHGHSHSHVQSATKNTSGLSLRRKSVVSNHTSVQELDLDMSVDIIESSSMAAVIDSDEKAESALEQLANMIADCLILLRSGFPASHLMTWLNEVSTSLPSVQQLASFWTFKAEVAMKMNGDECQAAIAVLDEAIARNVEPLREITESRSSYERLMDQQMNVSHNVSHGGNVSYRLAAEVQQENAFNSSAVKLCVRKIKDPVTPLKSVATPVRRSTRKSYSTLPPSLRDHDIIVESADEIAPEVCATMTFQENLALNLEWRLN